MEVTDKIRKFAFEQGITALGSAPVSRYSKSPEGHHPGDYLPETKTVITFAYPLNPTSILNLPTTRHQYMQEHHAANQILRYATHKIARMLEEDGCTSLPVSPTPAIGDLARLESDFSHKHSAAICGIGQFGLNNLLITLDNGPGVRLSSVFTTADISIRGTEITKNLCDDCRRCVDICPVGALDNYLDDFSTQTGRPMDKEKCTHYIHTIHQGNRCGLCMKVCLERFYHGQ
ncbi:MAG: 4Fe-4S binding protein [Methanohalobium sp.]|uniref:4Fe-4S binding protein n=1 Tax=Methanohalobium sp. TaxID=2837493 RepID=UPI00397BA0A8